jgi:ketosteroid isomerase-like protein
MVVLNNFAEAFRQRSVELMGYAPDPDVVVIGSDAGEKCVGINEINALFNRYFANFDELSLEFGWTMVSVAGTVAWVAADDTITLKTGNQETTKQGRLTFVLEKRGDQWLILQVHHSVPQD